MVMPPPPEPESPSSALLNALVADPVVASGGTGWQIGSSAPPRLPDPLRTRAARLEARLAVYSRYAAAVAEEAAAVVDGDEQRRVALTAERDAAAEHFAELRDAAAEDGSAKPMFSDALTDALHELRHQDAVDQALGRRLRALRDGAGLHALLPALVDRSPGDTHVDLRF